MRRDTFRYLALLTLLALGAGATAVMHARQRSLLPPSPQGAATMPRYVFHIDVGGWYAITPDEKAVASAYNLRAEGLARSLPMVLGEWIGTDLGPSAEIEALYAQPDLVLRRRYANPMGRVLWLTVIASHGAKSFHLFEHTPEICYGGSWRVLQEDLQRIRLKGGWLAVRQGVYEQPGQKQVVYHWYQWNSPARDPEQGIATWRLYADCSQGLDDAEKELAGFVNLLFDEVLPWHRF